MRLWPCRRTECDAGISCATWAGSLRPGTRMPTNRPDQAPIRYQPAQILVSFRPARLTMHLVQPSRCCAWESGPMANTIRCPISQERSSPVKRRSSNGSHLGVTALTCPGGRADRRGMVRLSWWIRAWRLFRCTGVPLIHRQARNNHANLRTYAANRTKGIDGRARVGPCVTATTDGAQRAASSTCTASAGHLVRAGLRPGSGCLSAPLGVVGARGVGGRRGGRCRGRLRGGGSFWGGHGAGGSCWGRAGADLVGWGVAGEKCAASGVLSHAGAIF